MSDYKDVDDLFKDVENPETEGDPESLLQDFESLPDATPKPQEQETPNRQVTPTRSIGNLLPEAIKPSNLQKGYDALTGTGASDRAMQKWVRDKVHVPVVDAVDNLLLGNKRSKEQITTDRENFDREGNIKKAEKIKSIEENYSDKPNIFSETIGVPIGAKLGLIEGGAELVELFQDATALPGDFLIQALGGPKVNPSQIPFHNKYEWAKWDLGKSTWGAKSGIGQIAMGFYEFAHVLKATGGFAGLDDAGTIWRSSGKVGLKNWKGNIAKAGAVTKAGMIGGRSGIAADVLMTITNPEDGNLSNLIREKAPDWYPTWATALAIDDDDNMAEAIFKTTLEGFGLGYAADAAGVVLVGNRVFKRLIGEGVSPETAKKIAAREAKLELDALEPTSVVAPTQPISEVLNPEIFSQEISIAISDGVRTGNLNLYGLDDGLTALRSYKVEDQLDWYANVPDSNKGQVKSFLSLEAQFVLNVGKAVRPIQLPNGTVIKFKFDRTGTSKVKGSKEVSIEWPTPKEGIKGRNIPKGIDPMAEYNKKWREWREGGEVGPHPIHPDHESIGGWGISAVRQVAKIIREELPAGTIISNTPADDLTGGISKAQIRRGEQIIKQLPKEVESIYQNKYWEADGEGGWRDMLEIVKETHDIYSAKYDNVLDSEEAFSVIKKLNSKPNAKNIWEALLPEHKMFVAEQLTSNLDITGDWQKSFKEPNIRESVYKRIGFSSQNQYGTQFGVVRTSPDGRGRWVQPVEEVFDRFGNVDEEATEKAFYQAYKDNINVLKEAGQYVFSTRYGFNVPEGRWERYTKLIEQSNKGIPVTWDDVRAVFPEYFTRGTREVPSELHPTILKEVQELKAGDIPGITRTLDGEIVPDGSFLVNIDGREVLSNFDEKSVSSFLTKNSDVLSREDVAILGVLDENKKPTLKISRIVAADDEAQALGMLFDQPSIVKAETWVQARNPRGNYKVTNWDKLLKDELLQEFFKEVYIANYRQSDWDLFMTPGGAEYTPSNYERIFEAFLLGGKLDHKGLRENPPEGLEYLGTTEIGDTGSTVEFIETFGRDALKDTKGNHLKDPTAVPHERRTVTPTEAAAQQLQATKAPPGTRTGSARTLTNAQIRLLAEGAPEGTEAQLRQLVQETPIKLSELSDISRLSEREIVANATQGVAEALDVITGKIDFNKLDVAQYGARGDVLLTRTGIVQTRMLMQEMSKGLWESAHQINGLENFDADSFKQIELLTQQWKTLARTYKVSANAHGNLLRASGIKLPWGDVIDNVTQPKALRNLDAKLRDGEKVLDDLVKRLKEGDVEAKQEAMRIANSLLLAGGDINITHKMWQYIGDISVGQGLKIMYNSLLSGPATHLVNTISNAFNTVYRPLAAMTGGDMKAKQMAAAGFYGLRENLIDSWNMVGKVVENDWKPLNDGGKGLMIDTEINAKLALLEKAASVSDDSGFKAGAGVVKMFYDVANFPLFSWPSKFLAAQDEFFKTMGARMEYNSRIMEVAIEKAEHSGDVNGIFENLLKEKMDANFDPKTGAILNEDLLTVAKENTFQTDLEGPAARFATFINEAPLLRPFFPFVKTGHNIMVYAGTHTPLLSRHLPEVKKVMNGDDAYAKAMMQGRQAYGRMMVISGAIGAYSGLITGNGPADREARETWLKTNQPRSIRVGDVWFKYDRIEPLGQLLAGTADIVYGLKSGTLDEDRATYLAGYLTYSIAANLTQKSFFQGLVPLGKLLSPGAPGVNALLKVPLDLVNSFIPLSSARRTFANMHTPYYQEFNNQLDRFVNQVSWGIVKGNDTYDWLTGDKVGNDHGLANALMPLKINKRKQNIVYDKLQDIEFDSAFIVRELGGIKLTSEQRTRLQQIMGNSGLYEELKEWVTHPEFDDAVKAFRRKLRQGQKIDKTNEYFYKEILTMIRNQRDVALEQVQQEFPELRESIDQRSLWRWQQGASGSNNVSSPELTALSKF